MNAIDIRTAGVFQGPDAPSDDDLSTCVHCGLCLDSCPTYRITNLETESPRGRLYLMTQWKRGGLPFTEDLARHIDLCLGCRTCEAVCPSGVPYGRIIEQGRAEVERLRRPAPKRAIARLAMRSLLPHPGRLAAFGAMTRAAQTLGLTALLRSGRQLPLLRDRFRAPTGGIAPAVGPRRHRVAFLTGCVMPLMFPQSHQASIRLLQLAGCEVWFPPEQRCCGALFAHNGDLTEARRLREVNERAFAGADFDHLVVNSAGCSSHLKDFYPALGTRTVDLFEFLDDAGLPEPTREVPLRVTYQDPCHLAHAQRIRAEPRRLLRAVPGVEFVEMPHADICCGSAGIYNVLEPGMSGRILAEKMDSIMSVRPDAVVTANPGCQMQLLAGVRGRRMGIEVLHLAELMARAYGP
ncbi:MAG: heterodisulfide reductase-related iron-sulfur binding cluster [Candidatus Dormibacteraceae bacterium]